MRQPLLKLQILEEPSEVQGSLVNAIHCFKVSQATFGSHLAVRNEWEVRSDRGRLAGRDFGASRKKMRSDPRLQYSIKWWPESSECRGAVTLQASQQWIERVQTLPYRQARGSEEWKMLHYRRNSKSEKYVAELILIGPKTRA